MSRKYETIKGRIKIQKGKKGTLFGKVSFSGKEMPVPTFYALDEKMNDAECDIVRENGQIKRILCGGQELQRWENKALLKKSFSDERKPGTPVRSAGQTKMNNYSEKLQQKNEAIKNIYDATKTMIPADTRQCINNDIDNFSLKLNKFAYLYEGNSRDKRFIFYLTDKEKVILNIEPDFSKIDFSSISARREDIFKLYNQKTICVSMQTQWRLAAGLGIPSVYETSLLLHPVYGFPFIAGSAIKGVARSYTINELFAGNEKKALRDEGFCKVFGTDSNNESWKSKGMVHFYDAFPLTAPKIDVDIMNPHYSEYYNDDKEIKPPGDYYNPMPIFFLTVMDGDFCFYLGIEEKNNIPVTSGIFTGEEPLQIAVQWMQKSLAEAGLGAKTAVGYGYFSNSAKRW